MLTPEYIRQITEAAEENASRLHNWIVKRIISRIVARVNKGLDYLLTAVDKWNIETIEESGKLREEIEQEIEKYTGIQQKEIKEAMEDAGVTARQNDDEMLEKVGIPAGTKMSPNEVRALQRNYEATAGTLDNFTRTTADATQRRFIEECDNAYRKIQSGAQSYTEAFTEAIENIAKGGVYVTYTNPETGKVHKDTIETATLRALRTGISQATAEMQLTRMAEMGINLALTSSHMGARPDHVPWQGKVFWVDWDKMPTAPNLIADHKEATEEQKRKYPEFVESTGYGTVTGLCGANCRHHFGGYVEGMPNPYKEYDPEEVQKQYEQDQEMRKKERAIRKTKRAVMGLQQAVDELEDGEERDELQKKLDVQSALLKSQTDDYYKFCDEHKVRPLEERIVVAQWTRQNAARAREAAKRHANREIPGV